MDGLALVLCALRMICDRYASVQDSENGQMNCFFGASLTSITSIASSVIPLLQCILQQNTMQKVCIITNFFI